MSVSKKNSSKDSTQENNISDSASSTKIETAVIVDSKNEAKSEVASVLSYEELKKFEKDPKWVKIRIATVSVFWSLWVILLAIAILIIFLSPKCPVILDVDPKSNAVIYNINVPKFKVSGKGTIGNLAGIQEKMAYISKMGSKYIVLSSIFETVNDDCNYRNVQDYSKLNPVFGISENFSKLAESIAVNKMELLLRVPLNVEGPKCNPGKLNKKDVNDIISKIKTFSEKLPISGYIFENPTFDEVTLLKNALEKLSSDKTGDEAKSLFSGKWILYDIASETSLKQYAKALNDTTFIVSDSIYGGSNKGLLVKKIENTGATNNHLVISSIFKGHSISINSGVELSLEGLNPYMMWNNNEPTCGFSNDPVADYPNECKNVGDFVNTQNGPNYIYNAIKFITELRVTEPSINQGVVHEVVVNNINVIYRFSAGFSPIILISNSDKVAHSLCLSNVTAKLSAFILEDIDADENSKVDFTYVYSTMSHKFPKVITVESFYCHDQSKLVIDANHVLIMKLSFHAED
ncbi:hypothetical protein A3Q56_07708 [Intoshia linei]|uniref:Glycosyl hydrolase family 13 catalytic domain-containing protein n=1 Tax=Intoshia linei TaxID=1819745 RepID=A0A177ASS0_9BILA|nr:hypothetical protein A3Q56_07708 [Intoshia linei]